MHSLVLLTALAGKRKNLKIFLIVLAVILISSCHNDKLDRGQPVPVITVNDTISGTFYKNCNHAPDSNQKVTVSMQGWSDDDGFTIISASAYTDSKGHFSIPVNYNQPPAHHPDHNIIYHDSCSILQWPLHTEHSFVTNDTVHLKINILVNNPLTANDTLYYRLNTGNYSFITGPFTSGIISRDFPEWRSRFFSSINTSANTFTWAIGANNLPYSYNTNAVYEQTDIQHISCSLSDTITIQIN